MGSYNGTYFYGDNVADRNPGYGTGRKRRKSLCDYAGYKRLDEKHRQPKADRRYDHAFY